VAARGDYTVRVEGLREVTRALQRVDSETARYVLDGLKEAAGPVSQDANRRLGRFQGVGAITSRASPAGVFIRQSHRKVTNRRGDFGALQMRVGLIPAATEGEGEFVSRVDSALDRLISKEGFG
jgi:hypothetical protein